jgi:aspartyl-tRNA(Asn)/glutamyl-tRNA(Gln) amidotransferase subunit C
MAITPQQVEHVATLARIGLSKEQVAEYTQELSKILAFVEQLKEVDTENVPETSHVTGLKNITRPDATLPPLDRQVFLGGAPAHEGGQLKVKGVFNA